MSHDVTVAILAGGQSSRMGHDKSFVELANKPLIAHVLERVKPLSLPMMIIANQPEPYQALGLPVLPDIFPDRSSLNGLYSALMHSQTEYTVCVACDMPFLNPALLAHIISLRAGYDAIVPFVDDHPQGLHALYRKTYVAAMLRQLERNDFKIGQLYGQLNIRRVEEDDLRRYDRDLTSFVNINTPEALRAAENVLYRPHVNNSSF